MERAVQVKEGVNRMRRFGIFPKAITEFKAGVVNRSEGPGFLYWLDDAEQKMVQEFELAHNAIVYHVVKTRTEFGLMYALLYVSQAQDEWELDLQDIEDREPMAYVVNMDAPECSEFGHIGVKPQFGGLVRTY